MTIAERGMKRLTEEMNNPRRDTVFYRRCALLLLPRKKMDYRTMTIYIDFKIFNKQQQQQKKVNKNRTNKKIT